MSEGKPIRRKKGTETQRGGGHKQKNIHRLPGKKNGGIVALDTETHSINPTMRNGFNVYMQAYASDLSILKSYTKNKSFNIEPWDESLSHYNTTENINKLIQQWYLQMNAVTTWHKIKIIKP